MNLATLGSIRIWFLGLFLGAIVMAITGAPAGVGIAIMLVFVVLASLNRGLVVVCPYCRKRAKIGASVCRWCGRSLV
ncbi:MAG: hypothetical protein ACRDLL_00745 [Solirubrobacterales bacterium]